MDLSTEVRDALGATLQTAKRPIGFFIQPGIVASTDDDHALRNLLRELVAAVAATPTAGGGSPMLLFDTLHDGNDAAAFYAISLLAQSAGDPSAPPIASRVEAAAAALGALVWDVAPAEGETAVVCFAIEGDEAVPA